MNSIGGEASPVVAVATGERQRQVGALVASVILNGLLWIGIAQSVHYHMVPPPQTLEVTRVVLPRPRTRPHIVPPPHRPPPPRVHVTPVRRLEPRRVPAPVRVSRPVPHAVRPRPAPGIRPTAAPAVRRNFGRHTAVSPPRVLMAQGTPTASAPDDFSAQSGQGVVGAPVAPSSGPARHAMDVGSSATAGEGAGPGGEGSDTSPALPAVAPHAAATAAVGTPTFRPVLPAAPAAPTPTAPTRPAPPAGPTQDAEPVEQEKPDIPDDLRGQPFKSFVRVRVDVNSDGTFTSTLRTSSGNARIDQLVIEALKRWRWKPALQAGVPVASVRLFKFEFTVD